MKKFSLKQLLGSTALAAIGFSMAVKTDFELHAKRLLLLDVLAWLVMWTAFVMAVLNLWDVPLRKSMLIGFAVGVLTGIYEYAVTKLFG